MNAPYVAEASRDYLTQLVPPLVGHFDLLAGAPQGVARLRELILSLAVSGKLVPQDPADEPASVLLERIRAEKDRLVAEGKIKRDKPLPAIEEDEKPFELPETWGWVRLGTALTKITDGTHHSPPNGVSGDFKYISAKNIKPWGLDLSDVTYVTRSVHEEIYARCNPEQGDVLYIKDGATTGVVTINPLQEEFSMLSSVALLKPSIGLRADYLSKVMGAPFFYDEIRAGMTGVAITRVTLSKLSSAIVPLPPLAEQARIVAKVEELMGLCELLEDKGRLEAEQHGRLVATLFDSLTSAESAHELAESWQRIAAHFDLLLDRPEAVDVLEQTVLQLAVRGLLVPQDPADEPASRLLERIRSEKDRLISAGKIKRDKPPVAIEEDKPFELPVGWRWVRLHQLLAKMGAGSTPLGGKEVYVSSGVKFLRSQNVWNSGLRLTDVAYIERETHAKMAGTVVVSGDLLFNITGASIGRCAVVPADFDEANVSQHVTIIRPVSATVTPFLHMVLVAPYLQQTVMDVQVGVSREGLSIGKLRQFLIPIPPHAEQSRIVARVQELRRLCTDLRGRLTRRQDIQRALSAALVEQVAA